MHSCCLISGIPQGDRSPRGPSEYDKHPAFKLRKATLAHEKRLAIHLANLDHQREEFNAKMAHEMKMTNLTLKRIQNSDDSLRNLEIDQKPSRNQVTKSVKDSGGADDENKNAVSFQKSPCVRGVFHNKHSQKLPPIKTNNNGNCVGRPTSSLMSSRKRLQNNSCSFGTTQHGGKCLHFPCQQPKTYHSLGFRLDDSSTQKWITWAELKKSQIDLPNYNSTSNDGTQYGGGDQGSPLRRWCSLPMDFESRKQRLKDEIEKRRIQNMANKPKSWETNYGKMTPYKVLAYPVRLHPLQMTTK